MPLFGIEYDVYRLFAAALSIAALVGFFLFLQHTKIGTWMRAVRHDRDTAIAMGIPAQRIYVLTFGIGFALAAFGGAVAAPITTVDFRGGVDILPFCFMAVIIGGLGNLPGTAAAAVLLAFFEGIIQSVADPTVARIASLVLMSAVLLLRPQGLFKGHDAMTQPRDHRTRACSSLFAAFMLSVPWSVPGADQHLLGQRDRRNPDLVAVCRERQSAVRLCRAAVVRPGALFRLRHVRRRRSASTSFSLSFWPAFGARHRRRRWRWRWSRACSRSV